MTAYIHLLKILTRDEFIEIQERSKASSYSIMVNRNTTYNMSQVNPSNADINPFYFMKYDSTGVVFQIIKITPKFISLITTTEGLEGRGYTPGSFFGDDTNLFSSHSNLVPLIIKYDVTTGSKYIEPTLRETVSSAKDSVLRFLENHTNPLRVEEDVHAIVKDIV